MLNIVLLVVFGILWISFLLGVLKTKNVVESIMFTGFAVAMLAISDLSTKTLLTLLSLIMLVGGFTTVLKYMIKKSIKNESKEG